MVGADAALDALVVGCGGIGSAYDEQDPGGPPLTHASAYAAHPGTRLAGGVDPDPERRERFEGSRGAACHPTIADALAHASPAVASVCTPVESRLGVVNELVEAGVKAIWCEKPLAADPAEGRALAQACAERDVALQVNFLRRFDALHRHVVDQASGGPVHADFRYSGSMSNYGSHAFDLFRWLAGEVEWVQGRAIEASGPAVLARAENGSTATFLRVRNAAADVFDVTIYASESRITISCLGQEMARADPRPTELFPGYVSLPAGGLERSDGLVDAMLNGAAAITEHLAAGVPLPCDGRDGVAALEIEAAVARSLETGDRVRPSMP